MFIFAEEENEKLHLDIHLPYMQRTERITEHGSEAVKVVAL